jgi:hypothetical protein
MHFFLFIIPFILLSASRSALAARIEEKKMVEGGKLD